MCGTMAVSHAHDPSGRVLHVLNTNTVIPELKFGCQPCATGNWREI